MEIINKDVEYNNPDYDPQQEISRLKEQIAGLTHGINNAERELNQKTIANEELQKHNDELKVLLEELDSKSGGPLRKLGKDLTEIIRYMKFQSPIVRKND